jgi:DNA-binding FadR family transcriptional regulator
MKQNSMRIERKRVTDQIIDQLISMIDDGKFKPGDKLPPERHLSEEFQVSRIAIREALRALEGSGFVTTRLGSGGGTYVTDLGFENLSSAFFDLFLADKISLPEIHHVRLMIDGEVGRLAALNITPDFRQRLLKAREVENHPDHFEFGPMSTRVNVHYTLAEMSGNRFLEAMVKLILAVSGRIIDAFRTDPNPFHPPGSHLPIIEAVLAGDPEAASEAMRKHAMEVFENLMKLEEAYRKKMRLKVAEF